MSTAVFESDTQRRALWRILDNPSIYQWVQRLLAPGAEKVLNNEIGRLTESFRHFRSHLDVGCGPTSRLWRFELDPIGVDLASVYAKSFQSNGGRAVTGTVTDLPFSDRSFDVVWNFGLLHHLSDEMVGHAIGEMARVVRPGGVVVVFDGVMPESAWRYPVAWVLRKLDRGRHMRRQNLLESLLAKSAGPWSVHRFHYSWWGHEGILCVLRKPDGL